MSYTTKQITAILREARENKGLSQRELSAKSGVPQGRISKIEAGIVDLRVSSLVELARALDLELTLVPRQALPAVKSIVRSSEPISSKIQSEEARLAAKELKRLRKSLAEHISGQTPNEFAQLQRQIQELQRFQLSGSQLESLRSAAQTLKSYWKSHDMNLIRESLSQFKNLRNELAHGIAVAPQSKAVRPAYSLDEDDHG